MKTMTLSPKVKRRLGLTGAYILAIVLAIVFLFPFYYTIINSLRPINSSPALLTFKGFEFENFNLAVTLIPFWRYLKNSIIIEAIGLTTGLFTSFAYGYALARLKAPGKTVVFYMILSSVMVPAMAIQVPQYVLFSNFGLKDTYWIYVINGLCGSAVNVFTYRQYLVSFSSSIEEAAMIDGCTRFSIMWRIVAPISKPIIAVVLFKDFLMLWNDYMTPYMYLSQNKYPIAMALFGTSYIMPNNPGVKLVPVQNAAAILITIPTLIVFFICQKQLVADVTAGSIKE